MKKLMLTLLVAAGGFSVQADNYKYLTFETTDGTKTSIAVESLKMGIDGTMLTAGSQTFALSNLAKMYFSNTDSNLRGDVNEDGIVSVADVTALVNMILGKTSTNSVADVNQDGSISIADVTTLVNIILNKAQ